MDLAFEVGAVLHQAGSARCFKLPCTKSSASLLQGTLCSQFVDLWVLLCSGGRLLMHMALQSEAKAAVASAAAEKRAASKAAPGRVVSGTVTHSSPLVADIKLESGEHIFRHSIVGFVSALLHMLSMCLANSASLRRCFSLDSSH